MDVYSSPSSPLVASPQSPLTASPKFPWSPTTYQVTMWDEPMDASALHRPLPQDVVAGLFAPSDDAVPIIHPEFKPMGRLWIALQWIYPTSGLNRFMEQHPHPPSLCMLFQRGRCNSHAACNQIHVDVRFAHAVAQALQNSTLSNCCKVHGDLPSNNSPNMVKLVDQEVLIERDPLPPLRVPHDCIAMTMFWTRVPKHKRRPLVISAERICNLHQQFACKFGVECRNVHICREFLAHPDALPVPAAVPVQAPAPATVPSPESPALASPSEALKSRRTRALEIVDPVSMMPVELMPAKADLGPKEPTPSPDLQASAQLLLSFPMLATDPNKWLDGPVWNPDACTLEGRRSSSSLVVTPDVQGTNPAVAEDDNLKDVDDFSSLAEELKSIQDEINEVGDEMKGRLEVKHQDDQASSEPSSPLFFLSEISPASPFFMAPSTVSAFEYANQAAVSCAFSIGTANKPKELDETPFFCLAEVMPSSPFFLTSGPGSAFEKALSCAQAADQPNFKSLGLLDSDRSGGLVGPSMLGPLSDRESAWARLVPL
eukprot:GGOE01023669.1.p1 GENE.GGOE01023669.1~~GGOE01023669.1.p1  ORF type:complete len:543 (-),score=162.70 GGOE01023669.1:401-2029(-)